MIKTALLLALASLASAQDLGSLADQAVAAAQPVLDNTDVAFSQTPDATAWSVNDYEWSVTEQNGEYGFNTNTLADGSNSIAPALSSLLANVGDAAQQNGNEAQTALATEADSVGVDLDSDNTVADTVTSAGEQLQDNADSLAASGQDNYDQGVDLAATNTDAAADAANDQAAAPAAVGDAVDTAVSNANAANAADAADAASSVSPVELQTPDNAASLANEATQAATGAAGDATTDQAADAANGLVDQGADASGSPLPTDTATDSVNAAADSLQANGVNNADDAAASFANGGL